MTDIVRVGDYVELVDDDGEVYDEGLISNFIDIDGQEWPLIDDFNSGFIQAFVLHQTKSRKFAVYKINYLENGTLDRKVGVH